MAEQPPSTPNPDPTVLTTAALYREVAAMRELLEQRMTAVSTVADQRTAALEQVFNEKLLAWQLSIKGQFEIIERQRVEQKADTKQSLDAAFQAAKDAGALQTEAFEKSVGKSESATNKALDQLGITFNTEIGSLRRELGEVKDRVNENDRRASTFVGGVAGANTQRIESRHQSEWGVGIAVAVAAAALSGIVSIGVAVAITLAH